MASHSGPGCSPLVATSWPDSPHGWGQAGGEARGSPACPRPLGAAPVRPRCPSCQASPGLTGLPGLRVSVSGVRPAPHPTDPWGLSARSSPHTALTCRTRIHSGSKALCRRRCGQGAALRGCPPGARGPRHLAWPTPDPGLPLLTGLGGAHSCWGASRRAARRAEPHGDPLQAPCPPCALGSSWRRGGGGPRRSREQPIHSANSADSPASAS